MSDTTEKKRSFLKRSLDTIKGAGKTISNYKSALTGKSKRQKMFNTLVNREATKKHGGGQPLADSPQNKPLYDNIRKELLTKFRKKNPDLWKDIN